MKVTRKLLLASIISFILCLLFVFSGCQNLEPNIDIGVLNATKYPAIAVPQETIDAMKLLRETQTQIPTPTHSKLDMIADPPESFNLKSGQYQFIEFFRYG